MAGSVSSGGFGQLVVGPPGAGKTTYCRAMGAYLASLGREVAIVNLDPANEDIPYACTIDVRDMIRLDEVMERLCLGPNGGLVYCIEYLEKNIDWLIERLTALPTPTYVLFDCPGQVELYTHHNSIRNIAEVLHKTAGFQLVAVHLVDSHYCNDASKFTSVLLTSLCTMMQLGLPHVNVLSKMDLIERFGRLAFNLDFYTEVLDLDYMVEGMDDGEGDREDEDEGTLLVNSSKSVSRSRRFMKKHRRLTSALCGVVQDYSLVSFATLDVQDIESLTVLMQTIDKANGYVFGALHPNNDSINGAAVGADLHYFQRQVDMQERYFD